ncbi:MAG: DNA-3-methyladenine glycosylase 2 family protein, partial [Piscinibacter sp.]|nr:DNA-3-methyladenine glycosylase 2 family protein [Piscinibacter sp.]
MPSPVAILLDVDADAAYRALTARDARFDGHWFVGVTSTGVYCRPICRVRTPRRENCRFFTTPAQAEAAAFRPCLKCRPELAPGPGLPWSVMEASSTLARQAAQWLAAHAFDDADAAVDGASPAAVARRLGVSERHLRRIFAAEHGVSPLQYVRTRRLLLAKQLLTDTSLPVTQVAHASGFRSLRRFNAAFVESYRLSPSRLRRDGAPARPGAEASALRATLAFREPYARDALLRFVERRAIPGVEHVDGRTLRIRRSVRADALGGAHAPGWVEVAFVPGRAQLELRASD